MRTAQFLRATMLLVLGVALGGSTVAQAGDNYIRTDVTATLSTITVQGNDAQSIADLAAAGIVIGATVTSSQMVDEASGIVLTGPCVNPAGSSAFYPADDPSVGLQIHVGDLHLTNFKRVNGIGMANDATVVIFSIDVWSFTGNEADSSLDWLVMDNTPSTGECATDGKGAGMFMVDAAGEGNITDIDLPTPEDHPNFLDFETNGLIDSRAIAMDLIDTNNGHITVTLNATITDVKLARIPKGPIPTLPPFGLLAAAAGLLTAGGVAIRMRGRRRAKIE